VPGTIQKMMVPGTLMIKNNRFSKKDQSSKRPTEDWSRRENLFALVLNGVSIFCMLYQQTKREMEANYG